MDTIWALVLSSILISSTLFLLFVHNGTNKRRGYKLPPSPPSIPVVGPLLWLVKPLSDLIPTLHRLRNTCGSIITFKFGIFPAIFVLDRHLVYEALVQKGSFFSDREPIEPKGAKAIYSSKGLTIAAGNGAVWRHLRRNLASTILQASSIRSFSLERRRILTCLLHDLRQNAESGEGVILVGKTFRRAIFRLLVSMCFTANIDEAIVLDIEKIQRDLMLMGWKLNVFDFFPILANTLLRRRWQKFMQNRRRQETVMLPLIANRRNAKREQNQNSEHTIRHRCYVDSLLDLDLPVDGGRKPSDDEIVSLCSELLNAGTDSTATTFEWIMANLTKHGHVQERLFEEISRVAPLGEDIQEHDLQKMPYLKATVLEGLRRHPPAPFLLPHVASEEATIGGYTIPKGSIVNFAVAEMGWDGAEWEDPFEFRPDRFLGREVDLSGSKEIKMMPFGAGRRVCPGLALAMLHLEYYLACLVREFEWSAVYGEEIDLTETIEFTMVMKNPLRARIRPRGSISHVQM